LISDRGVRLLSFGTVSQCATVGRPRADLSPFTLIRVTACCCPDVTVVALRRTLSSGTFDDLQGYKAKLVAQDLTRILQGSSRYSHRGGAWRCGFDPCSCYITRTSIIAIFVHSAIRSGAMLADLKYGIMPRHLRDSPPVR
jgi:hypothetical protein